MYKRPSRSFSRLCRLPGRLPGRAKAIKVEKLKFAENSVISTRNCRKVTDSVFFDYNETTCLMTPPSGHLWVSVILELKVQKEGFLEDFCLIEFNSLLFFIKTSVKRLIKDSKPTHTSDLDTLIKPANLS